MAWGFFFFRNQVLGRFYHAKISFRSLDFGRCQQIEFIVDSLIVDVFLTAIVGFTQLVLGGMGVYVSLRPPKKEHHWYWIGAFMGVGLLGVALTGWVAQRSSNAQDRANEKIGQAATAATNANTAATNANNSALAAQNDVKNARDEARTAK